VRASPVMHHAPPRKASAAAQMELLGILKNP